MDCYRVTWAMNYDEVVTTVVEAPNIIAAINKVMNDLKEESGNLVTNQLVGISALKLERINVN